jgi:hypothetical protein
VIGLFSLTYGNIAVSALIVCGIAAMFTLAGRVVWYRVKVVLDDHYYPPRPELLDEYADHARLADEVGVRGDRADLESKEADEPNPNGFPDLDEDEDPQDPAGRHAPGEGRLTIDPATYDPATGYAMLRGRSLPTPEPPLLSGQDGGR